MILDLRIVFIFLITHIVCFAYDCFLQNDNYRCRLGSKTPYRFIGYQNDTPIEYPGMYILIS